MSEHYSGLRITVLGTRGSIPVSGENYRIFGGCTSAYLAEAEGAALLLDAGTGLRNVPEWAMNGEKVHILFSHPHLDHILGLIFFLSDRCSGKEVEMYGRSRNGEDLQQQLGHLFSPPLWPVSLDVYRSTTLHFHELEEDFRIGPFRIICSEGAHPGGGILFRVEACGKSAVLATDFEHGDEAEERLLRLAQGTDLLLYDGQYSEEDYPASKGFGHSTEDKGLEMMRRCGAKRLRIVHHGPDQSDEMLLVRERDLGLLARENGPGTDEVRFAREGEVILL